MYHTLRLSTGWPTWVRGVRDTGLASDVANTMVFLPRTNRAHMGLILLLTILGIVIAFLILFMGRTYLIPQRACAITLLLSAGRSKVPLTAAKRLVAKGRDNIDAPYPLGRCKWSK